MAVSNIMNLPNTLLQLFEEDEYLSQFIATNNENKFNNTLVQLTVEENIKKLTKGLQCVEQLICDQINENHEELCNQVTWIENLELIINEILSQIQNLQTSIELLKCKVVELFIKVQNQVVLLNRLHAVCDLLRKIIRIQNLSIQALDKVNVLSPNLLFEIKELIDDKDLKKITFLSKDLIKLSNLLDKKKQLV